MNNENNKFQIDIENLFKQNVNDLSAIKELYRKLKEVEEKFLQIKYIDSTLANKLKKEYEKLEKIILDENIQVQLYNKIDELNIKLNNDIETINTQMDNIVTIITPLQSQSEIQNILNTKKNIKFKSGIYELDLISGVGLTLSNNTKCELENNVIFKLKPQSVGNYNIFDLTNKENITINGTLTIVGDKERHNGTTGEWGHGLVLSGSKNITIDYINVSYCWGDGIYLGSHNKLPSENITINKIISDNNGRLGVAFVSCKNVFIDTIIATNTNGTAPQAGIDFEPNVATDYLQNISINNLITNNNLGGSMWAVVDKTDNVIDININNIVSESDGNANDEGAFKIVSGRNSKNNGLFLINKATILNAKKHGVYIRDWTTNDILLKLNELYISDVGIDVLASSGVVFLGDTDYGVNYGNIEIGKYTCEKNGNGSIGQAIRVIGNNIKTKITFNEVILNNVGSEINKTNVTNDSEIIKNTTLLSTTKSDIGVIGDNGKVLDRTFNFTSEKLETGKYKITHNLGVTAIPVISIYDSISRVSTVTNTDSYFIVTIKDLENTLVDNRFSFIITYKDSSIFNIRKQL